MKKRQFQLVPYIYVYQNCNFFSSSEFSEQLKHN